MNQRSPRKYRWWFIVITVPTVALIWLIYLASRPAPTRPELVELSSPPPLSRSSFLNSAADVEFVGSAVCAECHEDQHQSYLLTAHSKALSKVDPDNEPPSGEFHHAASGRHYEIFRRDNQLWHRESILAADEQVIASSEFPLRYLIGSGRHTRSYLVDADGFLMESPITWYASKNAWGMSPGYDQSRHWGFERPTDERCLVCHTGRVQPMAGSLNQLSIIEESIGCENCHGPGQLHVQRWRASTESDGQPDRTIANPSALDRQRGEAICAQCHLRGAATGLVRGRQISDFRPGMQLTDVRIDYQLKSTRSQMKVVGHVEQMHLSRCYQQTESLTCTTCHDPHQDTKPADAVAFYRAKCIGCHEPESCGLPLAARLERDTQDNCVGCHMPKSDTDIPHIAFTHHRIGVHDSEDSTTEADAADALIPILSDAHLPEMDRELCLAIAYLELSDKQTEPGEAEAYRTRARLRLRKYIERGLRDGEVDAAMARLVWQHDTDSAIRMAEASLADPALSAPARVNALFILGDGLLRRNDPKRARMVLEGLILSRRNSEDWLLLGLCRHQLGDVLSAIEAFRKATEISPFRPEPHLAIADAFQQLGRNELALRHQATARRLTEQIQSTIVEPN